MSRTILCLLVVFPGYCFSQIDYDSIYQVAKHLDNQTDQVEYLEGILQKASEEGEIAHDSLYYLLLDIHQKSKDLDREITTAANLAYHYYLNYQDEEAQELLKKYSPRINQMRSESLQATAWYKFGIILNVFSRYDEALGYFGNAIRLFEEMDDSTGENYGNALVERGAILLAQGRYSECSIALNSAKQLFEQNRDSSGMRVVYRELFTLFSQIELYKEAEKYADLSLSYTDSKTDPEESIILAVNGARNLVNQERYPEALEKYLAIKASDPRFQLYIYNGLIESLYYSDRGDSIRYYLEKLDEVYASMDEPVQFRFLVMQSHFLHLLSQNRFSSAEQVGRDLMDHATAINDVSETMMYNRFLAELYRKSGQFEKAFQYSNAYSSIRDSIQASNKAQALLLYQTQYETKEKEAEIDQLGLRTQLMESSISRSRLLRILLLTALGLLLLAGIVVYHRMQIRQLAKMQELRTSISSDLHDEVGSLLSGISMQADIVGSLPDASAQRSMLKEIGSNTRRATTTMRDLVWSIDSRRDKVRDLKDKIVEACSMMLSAAGFDYRVLIHPDVDQEAILNPELKKEIYLICKEAINNVAKHSNGSMVQINLNGSSKMLKVSIRDNGLKADTKSLSAGQGLDNMQHRAKKINSDLVIKQDENSYEVGLVVPIQ